MTTDRDELIYEVTEGGKRSLWDAFDQGRLAFHSGEPFERNPHRLPTPGYFHANMTEWERGWKREATEAEDRNEAAWDRQQQSLMESGGPDDSAYRRDMVDAGRGHLLR